MTSYEMTANATVKVMKRKLFSSLESYEIYENVVEKMHVGIRTWMANCVVCTDGVSLSTVFNYKQVKME